ALSAGCSGAEKPPVEPPTAAVDVAPVASAPPPEPPDGDRRLSDDVTPTRYDLHLDVDPASDMYSGRVDIDVNLARATRRIELHASGLSIQTVSFTPLDGRTLSARFELGVNAGLAVVLDGDVSGSGTLHFEFSGRLDEVPDSIYRVKAQDDWYVFTQFEAQMARDAFPCFDEPKFKTPFAVTITAPAGVTIVGNSPVVPAVVGQQPADGKQTVTFEPTKPIPTYLVALAIGPFDKRVADLDGLGEDGQKLPHAIYTVRGKQALTAYAAGVTGPILKSLVDY